MAAETHSPLAWSTVHNAPSPKRAAVMTSRLRSTLKTSDGLSTPSALHTSSSVRRQAKNGTYARPIPLTHGRMESVPILTACKPPEPGSVQKPPVHKRKQQVQLLHTTTEMRVEKKRPPKSCERGLRQASAPFQVFMLSVIVSHNTAKVRVVPSES